MGVASATIPGVGSTDREFSRDTVLEILSNQRRRFVVHHLQHEGGEVSVSRLARRVTAWENDKPAEAVTSQEYRRVRNALRQFHLPKMADSGFVEFDPDRARVRLTRAAADANFYVDSLTDGAVPWGVYYLGLAALSLVTLGGVLVGVTPLDALSPSLWGAFFVTALAASSLGHCYDNYYRMRLGAGECPSEADT